MNEVRDRLWRVVHHARVTASPWWWAAAPLLGVAFGGMVSAGLELPHLYAGFLAWLMVLGRYERRAAERRRTPLPISSADRAGVAVLHGAPPAALAMATYLLSGGADLGFPLLLAVLWAVTCLDRLRDTHLPWGQLWLQGLVVIFGGLVFDPTGAPVLTTAADVAMVLA